MPDETITAQDLDDVQQVLDLVGKVAKLLSDYGAREGGKGVDDALMVASVIQNSYTRALINHAGLERAGYVLAFAHKLEQEMHKSGALQLVPREAIT